jgi:soluble cytochrome b562
MESNPNIVSIPDNNEQIKQMFDELRTYEEKNLRINRIRMVCTIAGLTLLVVALIAVLINVGTVVRKVNAVSEAAIKTVNNINTIAEQVTKVDLEKLGKSIQNVAELGESTLQQVKDATKGLDLLVQDADEAMQHINSVNFEDLNNGIQRLNDVLAPMAKFFNIFN